VNGRRGKGIGAGGGRVGELVGGGDRKKGREHVRASVEH